MKLKRRFPNFFTGFEETEHEVNSLEDLHNIDWIKHLNEIPNWLGLYYSPSGSATGPNYLMSLTQGEDEVVYFVIGYLYGSGKDLGLQDYKEII
jgi:hypothetical protein